MDIITQPEEVVILLNDENEPIGTAPKHSVHTNNTPLHLAFSVFLFNQKGELLLQQRSHVKKTWPLVWSNSCCGHPGVGESILNAARRRLSFELGLTDVVLHEIIPNYKYRAERYGVVEHELCPVLVGFTTQLPVLNPSEVEAVSWMLWKNFLKEIKNPNEYSEWCVAESILLEQNTKFQEFYASLIH